MGYDTSAVNAVADVIGYMDRLAEEIADRGILIEGHEIEPVQLVVERDPDGKYVVNFSWRSVCPDTTTSIHQTTWVMTRSADLRSRHSSAA